MLVGASLLYLFSRGKIAYAPTSPQANILIFGAVCGLLGILLSGLYNAVADELSRSMSDTDTPLTSPQSIWHTLYHSLSLTLPFVLLAALVFGLTFGSVIGPLSGLYIGLLFGLVGVALFGLTSRVKVSLKLMDVVRWGWAYIRQRDVRAELRSMVGVGIGISLMARIIKLGGPVSSLYIGLLAVVAIWLLMGIIRGLSRGVLNRQTMDKRTVVKPNQGIWNSARNSILVGLIFGTLGGSLFGLVFALASVLQGSLIDALPTLLSFGLVGGVLSGMIVGLLNGGVASIQHAVLRFFLCILRKTPWNYVRFLNHAADRILLRKVGGGYIFVHGLLMKYFAELNKEDLRSQP